MVTPPELTPETAGQAESARGERPAVDLVTRRVTRFVRVEFWSWW